MKVLKNLFVSAGNSNIEYSIEGMEKGRVRAQDSQGTDFQYLKFMQL